MLVIIRLYVLSSQDHGRGGQFVKEEFKTIRIKLALVALLMNDYSLLLLNCLRTGNKFGLDKAPVVFKEADQPDN